MTGAERAQPQADEALHQVKNSADWIGSDVGADTPAAQQPDALYLPDTDEPQASAHPAGGRKALAALLILLSLGWIGAFAWTSWQNRPALDLPYFVSALATLSGPLVLLALLWVWLGRTPRREAERFTRAVEAMRPESTAPGPRERQGEAR